MIHLRRASRLDGDLDHASRALAEKLVGLLDFINVKQ